jgi:hypothetical protein
MFLRFNAFQKHLKWFFSFPANMRRVWNHGYYYSRIILEQRGEIRYFSLTARLQRNVARGLIIISLALIFCFILLSFYLLILMAANAKLERSHNEIYEALIGSASDRAESRGSQRSRDDMLELAQTIRDRDHEIKRLVADSASHLVTENSSLKARLDASSLSVKAIKVIQGGAATGGLIALEQTSGTPFCMLNSLTRSKKTALWQTF